MGVAETVLSLSVFHGMFVAVAWNPCGWSAWCSDLTEGHVEAVGVVGVRAAAAAAAGPELVCCGVSRGFRIPLLSGDGN